MKVDIAIITIREDEFEAVLQRFKPVAYREPRGRSYGICHIQTKKGHQYAIAIARCSEQGNDTSQKLANDLIHDLDPQLILVVGIAGGVPHDEFTLGDVIISTRIHNLNVGAQYENASSTFDIRGGIHPLISDITSNLSLYKDQLTGWNDSASIGKEQPHIDPQQAIISGDEEWRKKVRASLDLHFANEQIHSRPPKFKTASIASSNHLIRNPLILNRWREVARTILAVEMEAAGVYEAAQNIGHQYPVMAIRGISDIIGLQRDSQWTAYACHTAAAFTYAFVMANPIEPRIESETPPKPIKLFYSYSQRDEKLCDQLGTHLSLLRRQGIIESWHYRMISAGKDVTGEIDSQIDLAQIILLLVSSDFLASNYCYDREIQRAMQRHETGEARVIPIILRPVDWRGAPFGKLLPLPRDGKPITSWHDGDEAWADVAKAIRLVCEELQTPDTAEVISSVSNLPPRHIYQLYDVFKKSGVPHVTFVEREDFGQLKLALAHPGRGVVLEGPSGVGKTTAIHKAIEELALEQHPLGMLSRTGISTQLLNARDPLHQKKLRTLRRWHRGTVIVDDFHRLSSSQPALSEEIVDYLKYLADTEPSAKKLVIIGIPQSGQTLVDTSFDVATRVDVFRWGKVKDELVLRMIEKGEKALNIEFDRKTEIAIAASGSLNIAQFLCFHLCEKEGVIRTQEQQRVVHCNVNAAVSDVIGSLSKKFGESIRRFVAMGGHRDVTCLGLLEELARNDDGFLALHPLKERKRELAYGIERFISEKWMDKLYEEFPECAKHLFFDQTAHRLVIDDPQLIFYLTKVQLPSIAKEAGKVAPVAQQKVFISYSHKDARWLERLQVHLAPLQRNGIIDLWDDTKIAAGMRWKEEIQAAIEVSTVAVVLISADFLASDFISEHELPTLLSRARSGGTIILPLIVAPCLYVGSGVDIFQAVNSPDRPLADMTASERERTLVKLAETISKHLMTRTM